MINSNDDELLYLIYQMDELSLQQFVDKYAAIISETITFYFNFPRKHYLSDDIMADAISLLYDAIYSYRFDMETNFATYFHKILKNMLTNVTRAAFTFEGKCLRSSVSLDYQVKDAYSPMLDVIPNKDITLEGVHYLDKTQYHETIEKMCESLNARERRILFLRLKGHSYREIAELLHIDKKKVDNTLHKIRKKKGFIDYM